MALNSVDMRRVRAAHNALNAMENKSSDIGMALGILETLLDPEHFEAREKAKKITPERDDLAKLINRLDRIESLLTVPRKRSWWGFG